MDSNGFFKLLDIFRATLTKGSLRLPISLFSFLRRGIYLNYHHEYTGQKIRETSITYWFSATLPLLLIWCLLRSFSGLSFGGGVHRIIATFAHQLFLVNRHLILGHCSNAGFESALDAQLRRHLIAGHALSKDWNVVGLTELVELPEQCPGVALQRAVWQ